MQGDEFSKEYHNTETTQGTSVSRRGCLKVASGAVMALLTSTAAGCTSASETGYYGAGGYGEGAYGADTTDDGVATGDKETTDDKGDDEEEITNIGETSDPSIDTFQVTERDKSNPHAEFRIDWAVSDPDGELNEVTVRIANIDRRPIKTETISVDSTTASGTQDMKVKHHSEDTYYVTVRVTEAFDNMHSLTTRIEL